MVVASLLVKDLHQPWKLPNPPACYPRPIVDHAREHRVALDRFESIGP